MRRALYQLLVNRHIGIAYRYHQMHDSAHGLQKFWSWIYLLWLNFAYYILFCHFLGEKKEKAIFEQKRLDIGACESDKRRGLTVEAVIAQVKDYDVISFDIFDTLIFRPFSEPADLFYLLGTEFDCLNFHDLRMQMEAKCRQIRYQKEGDYEVTLSDIWELMEHEIGIDAGLGSEREQELELSLCYANPFMKEVYVRLKALDKHIVIVSDMYMPKEFLEQLLSKNGYQGYEQLYVSCEYKKSKGDGKLYEKVKKAYPASTRFIHVGDNEHSDVKMARKAGWNAFHYPSVNMYSLSYRPYDMSVAVGGAYRGIVNNHLYCGNVGGESSYPYSREYEYGFIYGGLFVIGYCYYIHNYCKSHDIDKILFLSRDGDILKQVYDYLFPLEQTKYVYWSRKAATKLAFSFDQYDFFRRFIYHKVNQGKTIASVLGSMELMQLLIGISQYEDVDEYGKKTGIELASASLLTQENADALKRYILKNKEWVASIYKAQSVAAERYYEDVIGNSKKLVAVDIGWAGSGAITLSHLIEKEWKLDCSFTGIIAGTNTCYNAEANASESFLQSQKLVSYMYSQQHNRDIWKKHDPNKDYNVFWEILLSSTEPSFVGFYTGNTCLSSDEYREELDITLRFGKKDANSAGIREVQRGIWDFVKRYDLHFHKYPYMYNISGRDAYAPMIVAASHNEAYLKKMEQLFELELGVN